MRDYVDGNYSIHYHDQAVMIYALVFNESKAFKTPFRFSLHKPSCK